MSEKAKIPFKKIKISSLPEILEVIKKYPGMEFFRGQADSKWNLIPRLARVF